MASGRRGRPSKYPVELLERAVRTRVAKELGIGSESLRKWVAQAEIDGGASPGTSTVDPEGWLRWSVTTGHRATAVAEASIFFASAELDGRR